MTQDNHDKRNFLFFLNEAHPLSIEDSLTGALATPTTWDAVAAMVRTARQKDAFARSINRLHLYVHVPFCGRLCSFCHCSRVLLRRRSDIDGYVNALTRQMKAMAPAFSGMDANLISFGGGTPSILDERQIAAILDGADKVFPASGRKVLFEVNPASWTTSKLSLLTGRGLSRLSIGVQSLDDKVLKEVSRATDQEESIMVFAFSPESRCALCECRFHRGTPGADRERTAQRPEGLDR
jgi:oxygen-independent coproporphyrinogen-3 oxidase